MFGQRAKNNYNAELVKEQLEATLAGIKEFREKKNEFRNLILIIAYQLQNIRIKSQRWKMISIKRD